MFSCRYSDTNLLTALPTGLLSGLSQLQKAFVDLLPHFVAFSAVSQVSFYLLNSHRFCDKTLTFAHFIVSFAAIS